MLKLNLEKAKEIHRNNLRLLRAEKFKELDAEFMKALEANNQERMDEIKALKQELRDLTRCEVIENATCTHDLLNHCPDCLGEKLLKELYSE